MRIYRQRVVKNGKSITVKKWYADVRLADGRRCRLPLFESKRLSQDFAAKLDDLVAAHGAGRVPDKTTEAWLGQLPKPMISKFVKIGLVDSVRAESNRQIDEHIKDYIDHLHHKGNTEQYCKLSKTRVQTVINGCKVRKLADLSAVGTFWATFFQAVTPRTAGFNTLPMAEFTNATLLMIIIAMLIGGNSCSTAGGMKVSTISVLVLNTIARFRGKQEATPFGRRITKNTVSQAGIVLLAYVSFAAVGLILVINFQEGQVPHSQSGGIFLDADH